MHKYFIIVFRRYRPVSSKILAIMLLKYVYIIDLKRTMESDEVLNARP